MFIIGPDPFISQSSPDRSSQLRIDFHIMKSQDQTSVLLSVICVIKGVTTEGGLATEIIGKYSNLLMCRLHVTGAYCLL